MQMNDEVMAAFGYLLVLPVCFAGVQAARGRHLKPRAQWIAVALGFLSAVLLFFGGDRLVAIMAFGFSVAFLAETRRQ